LRTIFLCVCQTLLIWSCEHGRIPRLIPPKAKFAKMTYNIWWLWGLTDKCFDSNKKYNSDIARGGISQFGSVSIDKKYEPNKNNWLGLVQLD